MCRNSGIRRDFPDEPKLRIDGSGFPGLLKARPRVGGFPRVRLRGQQPHSNLNQMQWTNAGAVVIPQIIFQTWKSKTDIPPHFRHWRQSFFTHNPGYDIRLLDDTDNRSYVETRCPRFLPVYDFFPREIYRADTIRPFYMFFEGGFYADMDFECLRPLTIYLDCEQPIMGSMGVDPDFPHSIPNAMFASPPLEGFWLLYLSEIASCHAMSHELRAELVTGPVVLKRCVARYANDKPGAISRVRRFCDEFDVRIGFDTMRFSDVKVLPGIEWYPLDWSDPIHAKFNNQMKENGTILTEREVNAIFGRSHAVTYWSHTR
jgi:inositol phosphorylceramide mannosyltransferase catalytic subunit